MSNNTLKSINKVAGALAVTLGGTGAALSTTAVDAAASSDTGTLIVSIMTSLSTIVYGFFQFFKKNK